MIIWGYATTKPPPHPLFWEAMKTLDFMAGELCSPPATSCCGQMMVSLCRVFALGCQGSVSCVLCVPDSSPFPAENNLGWRTGAAG